ncbi:programmed cell death protein (calcium-binding protein) [Teratosphaeria destructans]|uniref:Programmed cell death protein (Calcium-binding protein) n=1 Tax=Teratosphaeria destructans TaxID=418781 RepID=A0A9W7SXU5_9PEZI|nr:programmed cell death protein (calcium-binding protein) [Teratosphaeria destructans]
MAGDNPALAAAEKATGMQPLNTGPKEPQPPQHDPVVSDPTIDQIPPALAKVPAPFEPFVLTLAQLNTNQQALDVDSFPSDKQFEDLVIQSLYPSGPVRTEEIKRADVPLPKGHKDVVNAVEEMGKSKVFKVVRGQGKAEIFIEAFDVHGERLSGFDMAYNRGYNPDALPAHAEPEQAAQMMGGSQQTSGAPPSRPHAGSTSLNYNKPIPPPPPQVSNLRPQDDRYGRQQQGQGYQSPGPVPGAYGSSGPPPSQGQGHNEYSRNQSSRYDSYGQQPQSPRYAQGYAQQQAPPPPRNNYTSPPPQNYGQGPPPQGYHNRPPIPDHQRPPTVAPPRDGNDRDALWPLFLQVDKDRSGQLSEEELRRALVNGDYTAFDPHTVKMMIRMFDTDRSGTINFDEFCGLWGFLAAWRGLFDRFDTDRSGNISLHEFEDALVAFGYRLSPQFVQLLFSTYAKSHSRGRGDEAQREKVLSFDLFVQACISLKRMTDVFKKYDSDRDGYITLSFEEFLTGAQSLFLFNSISAKTDTGLY